MAGFNKMLGTLNYIRADIVVWHVFVYTAKKQGLKPDFIVEVEDVECDGRKLVYMYIQIKYMLTIRRFLSYNYIAIKDQLSVTSATVQSVSQQDTSKSIRIDLCLSLSYAAYNINC